MAPKWPRRCEVMTCRPACCCCRPMTSRRSCIKRCSRAPRAFLLKDSTRDRDRQGRARLRARKRRCGALACRRPCRPDSAASRTDASRPQRSGARGAQSDLRAVKASPRSQPSCSWRPPRSKRMCSGYTRSSGSAIARLLLPRRCGKVCSASGRPRFRLPIRCRLLFASPHGLRESLGLSDQVASPALHLVEVAGTDAGVDQLFPCQDQGSTVLTPIRAVGDRLKENGASARAPRSLRRFGDESRTDSTSLPSTDSTGIPMALRLVRARAARIPCVFDDEHHRKPPGHG